MIFETISHICTNWVLNLNSVSTGTWKEYSVLEVSQHDSALKFKIRLVCTNVQSMTWLLSTLRCWGGLRVLALSRLT